MTNGIITPLNEPCYKKGGVYKITCLNSGKSYGGSTHAINNRRKTHLNDLKNGKHYNKLFQDDFIKHGEAAFVIEIVHVSSDPIERMNIEALLIRRLREKGINYNVFNNRCMTKPFSQDEIRAALNREKEIKRRRLLKTRRLCDFL